MQDFYTAEIAEKIRARREEIGITQAELARRAHTTKQNIAAYEQQRARPKYATLLRIATALDLALDWLFKNEGPKSISDHHLEAVGREYEMYYPEAGQILKGLKERGIRTREELDELFRQFDGLSAAHRVLIEKITGHNFNNSAAMGESTGQGGGSSECSEGDAGGRGAPPSRIQQMLDNIRLHMSSFEGPSFMPAKGKVTREDVADFVSGFLAGERTRATADEFEKLVDQAYLLVRDYFKRSVTPTITTKRVERDKK